jgi:hypothetical protein
MMCGSPGETTISDNTGDSPKTAVGIWSHSSCAAAAAKQAYLRRRFGDSWELMDEQFVEEGGYQYHRVTLRYPDGKTQEFYFK